MKNLHQYITQNAKNHLIFDFDETIAKLVIDWTDWHIGVHKILQKYEPEHKLHPHGEYLFVNQFIRKYGIQVSQEIENFSQAYELQSLKSVKPNPEIIDLIYQMSERPEKKLFIYSSNSKKTIDLGLQKIGLDSTIFAQIVTRTEVSLIKPDPEGFYLIYDETVPKEKYLMIGDSSSDEGVAEAAGIDFWRVEYF